MKDHSSPDPKRTEITNRRQFHRKAICDARLEFSRIHSAEKIIEAYLLTAMGIMGTGSGFTCASRTDGVGIITAHRGMDDDTMVFVNDNFTAIGQRYFPGLPDNEYPYHSEVQIIPADKWHPEPLGTAGIRVLAGWCIAQKRIGLTGLGMKLRGEEYLDAEIDFLTNLTDHMMVALQVLSKEAAIRSLEDDLGKVTLRAADGALRSKTAKMDLERTRFRLSGFNDIFQELSELKDSGEVIRSFLLVLLGIFSAENGYILYRDDHTDTTRMVDRGLKRTGFIKTGPEWIKKNIQDIFSSLPPVPLGDMRTIIVTPGQLPQIHGPSFKPGVAMLFRVDESAKGVLCLGHRLTAGQYGARERELLTSFANNFLVFLKNSKSFETIHKLSREQEKKNIELQRTVKALTASRSYIARLEHTAERIKSGVKREMRRSSRISVIDMVSILIGGILLGLVFNFASPNGINVIPKAWRRPSPVFIDINEAQRLFEHQNALFVDARPNSFYKQGHIKDALNLSPALFDFVYMMQFSRLDTRRPIVVYGRNISRRYDEETAYLLSQRGHDRVMVYPGGIVGWQKRKLAMQP